MPSAFFAGDFEQLVLLAVLRAGDEAHALRLRADLRRMTGREVSRGALYRTLDRLVDKEMLHAVSDPNAIPERGGLPRACFRLAPEGLRALRESRRALIRMWQELGGRLS